MSNTPFIPTREQLLHALYEAAELEHNLMCTYLYAAFSLRAGTSEGLTEAEASAVALWRREIIAVAIEEMGHLTAVWNITSALGGSPRFGRGNFPLDPGALPAGVVVKLAPFGEAVLQHFIHLERPQGSAEPDGEGFAPEFGFKRSGNHQRLTPMALEYDTVGAFYATLGSGLRAFVECWGEAVAFCGDPALQLSSAEASLPDTRPVLCLKTALAAFAAIIEQGEGARTESAGSHFHRFVAIRRELAALRAANPAFSPAFPAAVNSVQRTPMRATGRVWIEHEEAAVTVDIANAAYATMMRLVAYSYALSSPSSHKSGVIALALGLMRALTALGERAARLPAGPATPQTHAGVSFAALRDAAALPVGPSAHRYFTERFDQLAQASTHLAASPDARASGAARQLAALARQARGVFDLPATVVSPAPAPSIAVAAAPAAPAVEVVAGKQVEIHFEAQRCIHARFCVTGAPTVFLANVQGPWIHPDTMDPERLVAIAHECPSGAIRYRRSDGRPEEGAPPVNLLAIREAGPYALRGQLILEGAEAGYRATLCRCGASQRKPYCDGSHHAVNFAASGEPASGATDMLAVRDGPLEIDPQVDGPLQLQGNLEITSGTGRVVARLTGTRLCRCGGSSNKPYCDGTHARIGFRS